MMKLRLFAVSVAAAIALAACGGGDPEVPGSGTPSGAPTTKGAFSAVVSFGDSLSDVGTYAPATSLAGNGTAPYFGGQFSTNSATSTIWVQNLATSMGVVVTPALVGFAGTSVPCPAATLGLPNSCTAYGEGGARVTDPNGIGKTSGFLTVPVVTQIANHLARFTSFKDTDLILVWAGSNDVLLQFQTFATTAAQIQESVIAGTMTADQASAALFVAQTAAQTEMKKAAFELAGYVTAQILAKGGKYVAVMNLPDITDTPRGKSLPASVQPALTDLSRVFNLWLNDALTGQPVQFIDMYALYKAISANPAQYGFVNSTVPACDVEKIKALTVGQVTDGTSLFCNSTVGVPYNGMTTGADPTTWLFADSIHPTTGGHKAISDAVAAQLRSFGWL